MPLPPRPHLLGIDDGPFEKRVSSHTPLVGVPMEGPDLVEAVATTTFPVDGDDVTGFLADWVEGLRFRPAPVRSDKARCRWGQAQRSTRQTSPRKPR